VTGQPSKIGGYRVYRRTLPDEDYDAPLNADPIPGTDFVDTTAPPGATVVYTVRATLPGKPKIEGVPAVEAGVDNRDVFPPAAPARLDVLPEAAAVRLLWDPVAAPDLAGYVVYRAEEDSAAPVRLTEKPITDTFFIDTTVQPRHRYRYTVVAVDSAGNASPPSPEALADTL
jgi:fibronectin type 3 domain-containing protein